MKKAVGYYLEASRKCKSSFHGASIRSLPFGDRAAGCQEELTHLQGTCVGEVEKALALGSFCSLV